MGYPKFDQKKGRLHEKSQIAQNTPVGKPGHTLSNWTQEGGVSTDIIYRWPPFIVVPPHDFLERRTVEHRRVRSLRRRRNKEGFHHRTMNEAAISSCY